MGMIEAGWGAMVDHVIRTRGMSRPMAMVMAGLGLAQAWLLVAVAFYAVVS